MLLPVGHEDLRGRRLPYVTIAIIALNVLAFLGTNWRIQAESAAAAEVRGHILMLAAMHPKSRMTPEVQKYVDAVHQKNPKLWEALKSQSRTLEDAWDVRMRMMEPEQAQAEMDELCQLYEEKVQGTILQNYGYVPAQPTAISYLTSMFLHGGWLHLIFNMWFLWLAGTVLEDTWGRVLYPSFYLSAGVLATIIHGISSAGSYAPTIGASGAVAGLLGAFLVRFPKTKIQMMWFLFLGFRFFRYKFKAPAYALLPLWLTMELMSGLWIGQGDSVAHWAHVGGFVFGALLALVLRGTGLEHQANQAIEAKVSWTADPRMVEATEALEKNQPTLAVPHLQQLIAEKPDNIEAHNLLLNAHWRAQDMPAHREQLATLCRVLVNAREMDQAWERFEEFRGAGGEKIHKAIWMELCRYQESKEHWDRAATEYEKLAQAYPADRLAVSAIVAAARIYAKILFRPSDAMRLYREAEASQAPHGDLDAAIRKGLEELKSASTPVVFSR